ncbi:MAG: putative 4-hydroxybenzoate polyprenyltransferase [Terrimicrobiaceae bacterium]
MPFALGAMFVAAGGLPSLRVGLGVVFSMVFARTAAMTFNRLADWEIDKRNPRTAGRHRLASRPTAVVVCVVSSLLFIASAGFLNPLCLWLSPVALAVVFFYSLTKRFTGFAQAFLGLALAVAPTGGWIAVTGSFALPPLVLALTVLLWVAGFDMIYATQDYEIDCKEGLHSAVVSLGPERAIRWAVGLHALAFIGLMIFGVVAGLGWGYFGVLPLIAVALGWEHRMAALRDPEAINRAFFQANALVGLLFVAGTLIDALLAARLS